MNSWVQNMFLMLKRVKGVVKIKTILKELSEFVAEFDQMDWENCRTVKRLLSFDSYFVMWKWVKKL